ncbi:hypothetical protein PHSY_003490 [Pseudozyma hubeiensis SY62]|uniref:Uncharacterized protein n=1 Tax=Pseudozyma hubeiensis (strain SY62) TaxID=1305764 RepID=R9P3V0_PSEHS|nr:hypothetical protein PHSY_003490 [Pseudozyma hubeiensis SY62]GAC95912.1 hypothetical protein PHSY_003490 [Pseudozyma hubeiensis SY62]
MERGDVSDDVRENATGAADRCVSSGTGNFLAAQSDDRLEARDPRGCGLRRSIDATGNLWILSVDFGKSVDRTGDEEMLAGIDRKKLSREFSYSLQPLRT